jgi:hypothetical protein
MSVSRMAGISHSPNEMIATHQWKNTHRNACTIAVIGLKPRSSTVTYCTGPTYGPDIGIGAWYGWL